MNISIWQKLEITGLALGLISLSFIITNILFFSNEGSFLAQINLISMTLIGFILIGVLSSLLFLINLLLKRFNSVFWRLLGFIVFYLGLSVVGAASDI